FQGGAAEPAAMPQIGGVDISAAAVFDEAFCVDFREPFDLAQPEAQRITIAADPSLSALGGGEGWGEVGDSRAPASKAHLTLPSLRDGPLPLPPKGRKGVFTRRFERLQGAVPLAEIDVGRAHLDAVLTRIADDLRRRVKPHRLRVEQCAGEDIGMKAFDPGRDIDEESKARRVAFRKPVGAEPLDLVEAAGREIMAVA